MFRTRQVLPAALAVSFLLMASLQAASAERMSPADLTAAFLFRFASLTIWPESSFDDANSPLRFAIVGDQSIATALEELTSTRRVNGRNVDVLQLDKWSPSLSCHVLFLAQTYTAVRDSAAQAKRSTGILTISDSESFVGRGGMIELLRDRKKMRFSIDRSAATEAKLRIDPKLLRLAVEVVR